MQIAQLIADTCRGRLVAWSQHLLHMTISRKNKYNLKVNLRSETFGATADNIAESRRDDFGELPVVGFSGVGVGKTLRLGQPLRERSVSPVLCRNVERKQQ